MVVSASEHRLQMRILFVLSLLGTLVALAFSQSAGLFNPPSIIAAGAQPPEQALAVLPGPSGAVPGTRSPLVGTRPLTGTRIVEPRIPGTTGDQGVGAADDGLGGPIETADATGAVPPSIASDLGNPSPAATDGDGATGPGSPPSFDGPAGSAPGATADTTTPTDPGSPTDPTGPTDPGTPTNPETPTPTTPVPEPATWLIMILGVAIIGAALRRRRPAPAAFARA